MIVKNHHKENIPLYVYVAAVLILVVLALTSCYTPRKASNQVAKAAITYPGQTAKQLRLLWPCDTTGSDTVLIEADNSGYDAMIESLSQEISSLYDSLGIRDTTYLTRDSIIIKRLKSVRPKPDTVRILSFVADNAAIAACEGDRAKALDIIAGLNKKVDKLEGRNRTKSYILYPLLALILVWVVYRIVKLFK